MRKYVILMGIWLWMCLSIAQIQPYATRIDLRYHETPFTQERLQKIIEKEKTAEHPIGSQVIGWNEIYGAQVESKGHQVTAQAHIIESSHQVHEFVHNEKAIEGVYQTLVEGEAIISSHLAYTLWGSTDVLGEKLTYQENTYTVKGILEDKESLAMLHVFKDEKMRFDNLRIVGIDKNNIHGTVQQFYGRYGLEEGVIVNYSTHTYVFSTLICIIPLSFILKGLRDLYKSSKGMGKGRWVIQGILAISSIGMIQFGIKLLANLPHHLMPNKWSDFSFWMSKYDEYQHQMSQIDQLIPTLPQKWFEGQLQIIGTLLCISLMIIALYRRTPKGKDL